MLATGAGNAFAVSKKECESSSSCMVYDGGKINFDYKEIFVPEDKKMEFEEQQRLLEKAAHNLNLIKTEVISIAAVLPVIVVSILPLLKHYKDYKKVQDDLGISSLQKEIKNAKLELKKNKNSNKDLSEIQNKINDLKKEVDKIRMDFKGSEKDTKLVAGFLLAKYGTILLLFLSSPIMKLIISKIVDNNYRRYGDGWKFDDDGNLRTNFIYES